MSDTISIMRDGGIVQTGTPGELYDTPVDRYVADFVGESNFFSGDVSAADATQATIKTKTGKQLTAPYPEGGKRLTIGQRGAVAVRPEMVLIWPPARAKPENIDFSVKGRVTNRIYLGHQAEFRVVTDSLGEILARIPKSAEEVSRGLSPGDGICFGP